jgi:N-methylhydantoinase B
VAPDLVTVAVVQNGLVAATREMASTLERAAVSPLLFEFKDYSAVVTDRHGHLWAEAPGLLGFVGSVLPEIIQSGLALRGPEAYRAGDVWVANDPYTTGTHISDTTVYAPIFAGDELLAFCGATAHWADVGGKEPGGWCADSIDVFQEGLQLNHIRLGTLKGGFDPTVQAIIESNVRFPRTVIGDLRAQTAALGTGADRVRALAAKHGAGEVKVAMSASVDATEALLRRRIAELPDFEQTVTDELGHDGVVKDLKRVVKLTVRKQGDSFTCDFSGSSETVRGPINLPAPAARGAVHAAIKSVLIPRQATNHGVFAAVDVHTPPDSIVNPTPPAPVDQMAYSWESVFDLTIRALRDIAPDRCPAGVGRLCGAFFTRVDGRDGRPFVMVESTMVGWGATPKGDGGSMTYACAGDTQNIPAELIERRYPIRVVECRLRTDAAGAGKHRGGDGVHKVFEILEPGVFVHGYFLTLASRGAGGGFDGARPQMVIEHQGETFVFDQRFTSFGPLGPGDRVTVQTGGGGGWGEPSERAQELVDQDIADGLLSGEAAAVLYRNGHAPSDPAGASAISGRGEV